MLVQIGFFKKGNLDSRKHLKGKLPNPNALKRRKIGAFEIMQNHAPPLIWTALSVAAKCL